MVQESAPDEPKNKHELHIDARGRTLSQIAKTLAEFSKLVCFSRLLTAIGSKIDKVIPFAATLNIPRYTIRYMYSAFTVQSAWCFLKTIQLAMIR